MEKNWDSDRMGEWSVAIFGNVHRLGFAMAALTAEPDELYNEALARRMRVNDAEARKHLRDFRAVGLLKPAEEVQLSVRRGRPPDLFARTEDVFWGCLEELGDRFRRRPP